MRKLILHTGERFINKVVIQHLQQAGIAISQQQPAPDSANTLLCTGRSSPSWLEARGLCDEKGRVKTDALPNLQVLVTPDFGRWRLRRD